MDKLFAFKDKQLIKIITGVRRCGKSTLLETFQECLIAQGMAKEHIIAVNLEDYDYFELRKSDRLYVYIKKRLTEGKKATFDNIGNLLSTKKIADTMTSDGRKIDVKTVTKYLEALMESFVIYRAKCYNIKGKHCLSGAFASRLRGLCGEMG